MARILHRGTYLQPEQPPEWEIGLGDITNAAVSAMRGDDLSKLLQGVNQAQNAVIAAYKHRDELEAQIDSLGGVFKEMTAKFGPINPFNLFSLIAWAPAARAQANVKAGVKRLGALHLMFESLEFAFSPISIGLAQSGLTEASSVDAARRAMINWNDTTRARFDKRGPMFWDERTKLRDELVAKLSARGLKIVSDAAKDGYFDVMNEVIGPLVGIEAPRGAGASGMGILPVAIFGLIKSIVIVVGVVAAIAAVASIVSNMTAASRATLAMALEAEKRKSERQRMVAAGKLTQTQADAQNKVDAEETSKAAEEAAARAQKYAPSFDLSSLFLPIGVAVAAAIGLKVAGVW